MPLDPNRPARLALVYLLARHTPLPVQAVQPTADAMLADIESGFVSGLRAEENSPTCGPAQPGGRVFVRCRGCGKDDTLHECSTRFGSYCYEYALCEECARKAEAERDKALADLAACKEEHAKQIAFKIKECETLDGAWRRTKYDLAAERERAEIWRGKIVWGFYEEEVPQYVQGKSGEHELCSEVTADEVNGLVKSLVTVRAEVAQWKERAGKAEAEVRHQDAMVSEYNARAIAARAEAEAAKAELAKMRQRKVKLPLMYGEANKGDPPDMAHGWKMHDNAIEACADAIRAAGVEVEA